MKKVDYDPKATHTIDEMRDRVSSDVNEVTKGFKNDTKIIMQNEHRDEHPSISEHPGSSPEFAKKEAGSENTPKKIIDRNA